MAAKYRYIPAALRRLVIERATSRCEYCLLHQVDVTDTFQLDHIIARRHRGTTTEDNLALTCFYCNHEKGTDLGTIDVLSGEFVFLFHPRRQQWRDHLALQQAQIIGLTATGRVTVELLKLNAEHRLEHRQALINAGLYPPPQYL